MLNSDCFLLGNRRGSTSCAEQVVDRGQGCFLSRHLGSYQVGLKGSGHCGGLLRFLRCRLSLNASPGQACLGRRDRCTRHLIYALDYGG